MRFPMFYNLFRSLCSSFQPKIVGLAVTAIAVLFASSGQAASPGALDLSFGNRGTAALRVVNDFQQSRAVAIQPDGKVLVAGYVRVCSGATCDTNFAVVRFNTNGTVDGSFGTNGTAITDFFGQNESANAIAVQADGKIVVAGSLLGVQGGEQNILGFKLVRYNTDGTLDTSFGTAGRVYEAFDDAGGTAQSMFIQPDGKIVVAGSGDNLMLFVARFNPNGNLDTSFNTNGKIATNAYGAYPTQIIRQADGKMIIVAASSPQGTLKLIRFNTDGSPDSSFGSGGLAVSTFTDGFYPTAAVQADGKIIVSGYGNTDIRTPPLRRFNADGSVDTSLVMNNGATINGFCNCTQKVKKILALPDGRFYLVGSFARDNSSPDILTVSRYLSNGTIDSSFGFRGTSILRYSNTANNTLGLVSDAALQADGKIVISGTADLPVNNFVAIRINTSPTPPSARSDFDGDRKTDFAVFRPSNRFWYVLNISDNSFFAQRYGADGDVLTPGDYNYDGKTDLAVFRPSANTWFIAPSLPSGGGNGGGVFGQAGDISVPEDYDGDGYTDLAFFRPSNGTWNIRYSSLILVTHFQAAPFDVSFPFGLGTDKPVVGDYDGDGKADLAVFRPSTGYWYIFRSSDGGVTSIQFGISTDKTVQADYDGDGKIDVAVFRTSTGAWYIQQSTAGFTGVAFGFGSDLPVPGDYDGDGKSDVAVYRPSEGNWYGLKSSNSSFFGVQFGAAEDIPIPYTFVR